MSTATVTRDPPSLDPATFDYVRKLVQDASAIALEPNKGYLVESRLVPVAHAHGLRTVAELVALLKSRPFEAVHAQVVEAMTTNETSFFRDLHPFEVLKSAVLPPLIESRRPSRQLRIWSAACSTGQEPYTLALLLLEHFSELREWHVQILASDLSQAVLERAQRGEYSQLEVNRGLPAQLLLKYFERRGLAWRVKEDVRRLITFFKANLIEPWPKLPPLDVVFMRNVLIYFTPETKRTLLAKVRSQLAAGGTLFLGGAETTLGIDDAWQRVNHGKTSTYQLARK